MSSKDVLAKLTAAGIEVKAPASAVDEAQATAALTAPPGGVAGNGAAPAPTDPAATGPAGAPAGASAGAPGSAPAPPPSAPPARRRPASSSAPARRATPAPASAPRPRPPAPAGGAAS